MHSDVCAVQILWVYEVGGRSQTIISASGLIDPWGEIASDPRYLVGEPLLRPYCLAAAPLVFAVELAGLLEDPTASVGMISWFIEVAVNLAGSVQYAV